MIIFKDIGIINYLESDEKDLKDERIITICINSLVKRLKNMSIMQMNDTIVFIDEVASVIEFTHNDLLEKKGLMKETHNLLMTLISDEIRLQITYLVKISIYFINFYSNFIT